MHVYHNTFDFFLISYYNRKKEILNGFIAIQTKEKGAMIKYFSNNTHVLLFGICIVEKLKYIFTSKLSVSKLCSWGTSHDDGFLTRHRNHLI